MLCTDPSQRQPIYALLLPLLAAGTNCFVYVREGLSTVSIFSSVVPFTPMGFNTTEEYETPFNITFTLYWDPPSHRGVGSIVDYYIVMMTPQSLSHPISNIFTHPSVNVTLSYNVHYTTTIASVNCAGQSPPDMLTITDTGKSVHKYVCIEVLYMC